MDALKVDHAETQKSRGHVGRASPAGVRFGRFGPVSRFVATEKP
jgi:hypothetical protein